MMLEGDLVELPDSESSEVKVTSDKSPPDFDLDLSKRLDFGALKLIMTVSIDSSG